MVKRANYPFKEKWCLPGGFLNPTIETLEQAVKRILKKETNLEQLYIFDAVTVILEYALYQLDF